MTNDDHEIFRRLQPIVGLQLSIARRAADMRAFHFGTIRPAKGGSSGEYALHIQCPWRLDCPNGILTGRSDLWEPSEGQSRVDCENWDYEEGNLQDDLLGTLLSGFEIHTRSIVNVRNDLIVERLEVGPFGAVAIHMSGSYRLRIFPDGSRGEDWRLLRPGSEEPHLVISGGRLESECEE